MRRLTEIIKNQKQILELKNSVTKMINATDSTVTAECTKQKKESVIKDRNLKCQSEESKEKRMKKSCLIYEIPSKEIIFNNCSSRSKREGEGDRKPT